MKHNNFGEPIDVDHEDVSTLLAQEAKANGIVLEGLPKGITNDLKIAICVDGKLIENHDAAGGSLTNRTRKLNEKHKESYHWRNTCRKKPNTTHTEKLEEERESCHGHHCHATN